jgi:LysR family carnitine catabolism transcriptional activator
LEIRQAELFLSLADHRTMADAGAVLGVSATAMSRGLNRLERELRIVLFHRTAQGLRLTAAGRALVRPAREAVHSAAVARSVVANARGRVTGLLTLTTSGSAFGHLPRTLGEFRRRYPDVRVTIDEADNEADVLRRLRTSRSELGFGYLRAEDPAAVSREFVCHRLGYDEIGLLVPAGWTGRPALDALPDLPAIVPPAQASARSAVETKLRGAGTHTRLGVTTAHQHMQAPLVEHGFGVAWASRGSRDEAAGLNTTFRSLDPPLLLPVDLVHSRRQLTAAADAFVRALVAAPPAGLYPASGT